MKSKSAQNYLIIERFDKKVYAYFESQHQRKAYGDGSRLKEGMRLIESNELNKECNLHTNPWSKWNENWFMAIPVAPKKARSSNPSKESCSRSPRVSSPRS